MNSKNLLLAFLIISLIFLIAILAQNGSLMSDQFERARAVNEILATSSLSPTLNIYSPAPPNTYAPAFDLLSATLLSLTPTFPVQFLFAFFSFITLFLTFTYAYKLANLYLPHHYSLITACLTPLLPWIFRRILSPIPESIGLALFLMLLYYLLKHNHIAVSILFPLLALIHTRSFLTFGIIYLSFSVFFLWKKQLTLKELLKPAPLLIIIFLTWFLPNLNNYILNPFQNPWLIPFHLTTMFGIAAFLAILAASYETAKNKSLSPLSAILTAGIILSFLPLGYFSFREAAYIFFPIAFFSATAIKKLDSFLNPKTTALVLIVFFILIARPNLASPDNHIVTENLYFTPEYTATIETLNNFQETTITSDFISSYLIPYHTNHKVIIGPFMETLPDPNERVQTTWKAFKECSFPPEFFSTYASNLLYIPPNPHKPYNCPLPALPKYASKIASSDHSHTYHINV